MENTIIKDVVFDRKAEGYKFEENNFQASQELMVTITLNEYRELLKSNATATHDIEKANNDRYEREQKIKELTKENEQLKEEVFNWRRSLHKALENELVTAEAEEE